MDLAREKLAREPLGQFFPDLYVLPVALSGTRALGTRG
jgi:hypothetical protein